LVRDAVVYPAATLLGVCAHLAGRERISPLAAALPVAGCNGTVLPDLAEVRGRRMQNAR
jgi:magnesium chelatase family protein